MTPLVFAAICFAIYFLLGAATFAYIDMIDPLFWPWYQAPKLRPRERLLSQVTTWVIWPFILYLHCTGPDDDS